MGKNPCRGDLPTKTKAMSARFSLLNHMFFKVGSAELVIVFSDFIHYHNPLRHVG